MEFALDHAVFGLSPLAFRLHSLLWHAAGAVLLLLVLRRIVGHGPGPYGTVRGTVPRGRRAALLGAIFWAVHPVQTESAAIVSSRGDVAMGACVFASLLLALRSGGRDRWLALSLAAAVLASLYKETAVALPVVVFALRRLGFARVPVWPYFAVAAAYVVYRQAVVIGPMDNGTGFVLGGGAAGALATMCREFGFYTAQTVLPAFALDWYMTPSTSFADGAALAWLAAIVAAAALAMRLRSRAPGWTLAAVWFVAFLLPVANWPFFLGIPTTERFLYVPLAGAALAFALVVAKGSRHLFEPALVVVAALGAQAALRATLWCADDTLWDAVEASHESPRVLQMRAHRARNVGVRWRNHALGLPAGPDRVAAMTRARTEMEAALDAAHRTIDAWRVFEHSDRPVMQRLRYPELVASEACYLLGRDAEAVFHADETIRVDDLSREPSWDAYYSRAMPLLQLGYVPQALASMRRARELGMPAPTQELGEFFLQGAEACRRADLPATARLAFETAAECAPEGPLRRAAEAGRDSLRAHAAPGPAESTLLAKGVAAFDALDRTCPALARPAGAR
jgi:hypothetical protein